MVHPHKFDHKEQAFEFLVIGCVQFGPVAIMVLIIC